MVQAPVKAATGCTAIKKNGQRCGISANADGLCIRHVPAAVAARKGSGAKGAATRQRRLEAAAERVIDYPRRPECAPLRKWLIGLAAERGIKGEPKIAIACGLKPGRLVRLIRGVPVLLRQDALETLAKWGNENVKRLVELQGGLTAEAYQQQVSSVNGRRVHQRLPKGDPTWADAAAKRKPGQMGREPTEGQRAALANGRQQIGPASRRKKSMTAIRQRATDAGAPSWQRWAAERAAEMDLTIPELASRVGLTYKGFNYIWRPTNFAPQRVTLQRLEAVLGDSPADVRASIRQARSETYGALKRLQQRERKKMAKWKLQRLKKEVDAVLAGQAPSGALRSRIADLPYDTALGPRAHRIYSAARLEVARNKGGAASPPRNATIYQSPRVRLSKVLHGLLRRRGDSLFFQCQDCLQIWQRKAVNLGVLCGPCERKFGATHIGWRVRGGVRGPAPIRPKGRGRRIEGDIQEKICGLLRHRLYGSEAGPSVDTDYSALSDIRDRLADSDHPWCQRVTALLRELD